MGFYLSQPIKEKAIIKGDNQRIKYVASGMQVGMEDSHIAVLELLDGISLFGVFDGHGGAEVAHFVEKNFVHELQINEKYIKKNYEDALIETFLNMDKLLDCPQGIQQLQELKKKDPGSVESGIQGEISNAGCTANVVLITKNEIYCANAGDSRSILCRKGQVIELSKDHKPDLETEKTRITKAGGNILDGRVNGNLNLSRAIGDLEYKKNRSLKPEEQLIISKPDVTRFNLTPDDEFIVMGCDGIWECKPNEKILEFIREKINNNEDLAKIAADFLDNIIAKDTSSLVGLDNMTCIIICFNNSSSFPTPTQFQTFPK